MDEFASVQRKVDEIFRQMAGERAQRLDGSVVAAAAMTAMAAAYEGENPSVAQDIGFHMADWNSDAAFIVALHLFPERFTPSEVRAGVGLFLCHAPNHIREACRLTGEYVWESFPDDIPPTK
jgi:hypothetical protein